MASPSVVLVRRQSPDWHGLSRDFRQGLAIDPGRFVPDHYIPGFPSQVDLLIAQWNRRFRIDFFTFRAVIAELSRRSIVAVCGRGGAEAFDDRQLPAVAALAAERDAYVYFHDDDDFFSPDLAAVIDTARTDADAIVTPLFRIGQHTWTFARPDCTPPVILGDCIGQHFRYQTNNYGVSTRRCRTIAELTALRDHVEASIHADQLEFRDAVLSEVLSATVKTPGSASMLPFVFASDEALRAIFDLFIGGVSAVSLPEAYAWIAAPLRSIVRLVECVYGGKDYDAIGDLLPA